MSHAKNGIRPQVHTLDLNFLGLAGAIGCYLIPHTHGAVLVESGPGSTIPALVKALEQHNLSVRDISDVFITHIHLDHAGACGWLAHQGARIHVHPVGASHLVNPEKLLSSAERIYQDQMDYLWGEFLPVPEESIMTMGDQELIEFSDFSVRAIDTPGHASHHNAYILGDLCFTGDIGGIRLQGTQHLRIPMPPPEFHLETWRKSIQNLLQENQAGRFDRIVPTHFGVFNDPAWHLSTILKSLDEIEDWLEEIMPADPSVEEINQKFMKWTAQRSEKDGLSSMQIEEYEAANPSWMSGAGMQRYWRKYRSQAT